MVNSILVSGLVLFLGDLLSTFCYHVPSHTHGKFHRLIHHSPNRNYWHYAVLSKDPWVLLDGFWGALPYLGVAALLWPFSWIGVLLGLALGQLHVWWRHSPALGHVTPPTLVRLCNLLGITTPEEHWQHHLNPNHSYGDIFTILDRPARRWLATLRRLRYQRRKKEGWV